MKKRIICLLLCAVTLLPSLTAPVSAPADETAQTPASEAAIICNRGLLRDLPAEKSGRPSWISQARFQCGNKSAWPSPPPSGS